MRYVLFILGYVALVAWCITDALQHPDESPYGIPRIGWVIIILLFPYIGAAAWLILKFRSRPAGPARPRRPVAPDDDPEYLNWLRDQERRRRRGEQES